MNDAERLAQAVERLVAVVIQQRRAAPGPEPRQLTNIQGLALLAVADAGSLRLGALADLLGTTDATASRTVDVLERLELVRRARDPEDRRGIYVGITTAGRREVRRRRQRLAAMVGELVKGLPADERQRFVDLLDGLNDVLAAVERPRANASANA